MTFLYVLLILALVVAAGLFVALKGLFPRERTEEEMALEHIQGYSGNRIVVGLKPGADAATIRAQMGRLLQPVADRADRGAAKKGRDTLEARLMKADLKMTPQEFILIRIGCVLVLALVAGLRFGLSWQMLPLGLAGYFAPGFFLKFRQRKRLKAFNGQLADTLLLMANSMRAGQSFPQAIATIAEKAKAPIGPEFTRVVKEINLGGAVDDGLVNMVRRVGSEDLELVVTAVSINRQAGGNLAEMLEIISNTIRARVATKGEITALMAQGKMSGWFITLIPVALSLFLYFVEPDYFKPMTQQILGWGILVAAVLLLGIGNFLIRKITNIEV